MMGGLPRRDLVLLPLIAVLTVLAMMAGAEAIARRGWPEQLVNSCRIADPVTGYRYRADCRSTMKTAEGPWYTNEYNACGYRSAAPCGPVPADTRRIALIGSSLSEGYLVRYPDTVGARLGADLSAMCGSPVEVQNLGAIFYVGRRLLPRMDEALRLRPDAVVFVLSPFDLENELGGDEAAAGQQPDAARGGLEHRLFEALKASRAVFLAQHFLFRDTGVYLSLYLRYGDKADFLRPPFTPPWQERLRLVDVLVAALAARAHGAGVPLTIAFIPQEAEVALMNVRPLQPGIDPYALPAALATIAARHGVVFADTSVALRARPAPERLFYQADGHLSGQGQPIAAAYLAEQLAADPGGSFAACHAVHLTSIGNAR